MASFLAHSYTKNIQYNLYLLTEVVVKKSLLLITLGTLFGCSSVPQPKIPQDLVSITDSQLCEAFGVAYASKNTEALAHIMEEAEARGIEENDSCKMFIELGAQKYFDYMDSPSGFESFISTVDAIGTAGHTNNHTLEVK
ncbi:hypothetical protein CWO01_23000 [Vibrio splendidus]|jgi:hypothetical protein|nr:hypothetical protein BCU48_15925 [Vibrio splendidus]PTP58438.1 hypothetical protein CWO01_23000 [Vibrio splendidus]